MASRSNCLNCRAEFSRGTHRQLFCSKACRVAHMNKQRSEPQESAQRKSDRLKAKLKSSRVEVDALLAEHGHEWFRIRGAGKHLHRLLELGFLERKYTCSNRAWYRVIA